MKYCKICIQVDTRPGIRFNGDGICPACEYYIKAKEVDWEEREKQLYEIVEFGKANNHSGYDCIIGVSGGKDSVRQSMFVREKLRMNPLLVCLSYPPEQITTRGANNISNLISLGFDTISINLSPIIWKNLMRKSFLMYCNWCKSTEMALFSSVPRLAVAYQIPLIWWGENPALQLGDLATFGKDGSDGNKIKHTNTLGGGDASWMMGEGIQGKHILQYRYPSDEEMVKANLQIVYLGYFIKDWSLVNNGIYSILRGLDVRNEPPQELGDTYGITSLDEDWVGVNQMIKYLKFGFGRMSDYMNEEIRLGRISRDEAVKLAEKYDGLVGDQYIRSFCNYIGISIDEFWDHVDQFVNKKLFKKISKGKYERLFKIGIGF